MSSSTAGRKETERTKLTQEKCQTLLTQMLRDEDNKYCVDCDAKGPRWASWNLGVFLCIRCAGIHRNLGVHISRVKSVNLDTWTPEQVISLQQMGNSRARAVYEAQLPDGFRRPQTDTALESFIRAKYEHKKYLAREWVPPSPPKVDWAKEIDEELERQKRKKKAAQVNSALGGIGSVMAGDKKHNSNSSAAAKSSPLPAPLPKPKPHQAGSSPKTTTQRVSINSNGGESDLLGLSSPTKPVSSTAGIGVGVAGLGAQDLNNDNFSSFLSATTTATATPNSTTANGKGDTAKPQGANPLQNSLAQEEQDFFNQGSLGSGTEKDKSGKLSKDSILALYGTQTAHNPTQMNFGNFTGMAPGYMPAQQQPQQHQFMTPPNSVSMYNSPVMTAPNAFSAPSMNMGNATVGGFGAQFPPSSGMGGYAGLSAPSTGGGPTAGGVNLMQTNQSLLSGMSLFGTGTSSGPMAAAQPQHPAGIGNIGIGMGMGISPAVNAMQQPTLTSLGGMHSLPTGAYQTQTNTVNAATTANLNQQFGNLNIGNVWQ